jgi:hypothetical protein
MADASVKIRGGAGNATKLQSRDIDAAAPADTNVLAWSASDSEWEPTAAASGGSGGKIRQVLSTEKADVFTDASGAWVDVTGLSITISPELASSKIFVMYSFEGSFQGGGYGGAFRLVRDSTPIHLGTMVGSNRIPSSGGAYSQKDVGGSPEQMFTVSSHFLDSPGTTSATVYKIQANSMWTTAIYIGQSQSDSDTDKFIRAPATISVMEVGASAAGATAEWTDGGTVLYPTDSSGTVDNVVVGGTTTANSDIVLGVDGSAVFNEQGADVDFRIEGVSETNALFVQGSDGKVGIGVGTPQTQLEVCKGQNAATTVTVDNGTVGSGAAAQISLRADTGHCSLYAFSSDYSPSNQHIPDSVLLQSEGNAPGGLGLSAAGAFEVNVWTNSAKRMTVTSGGNVGVGVAVPGEKLTVDGVMSLKEQSAAPSATASFGKIVGVEDGIDSNTVLMLHCDGVDGAQVFTDSRLSPHTVTASGASDPHTDTTIKRFGSASVQFTGSDYLTAPDSSDWDMAAGDFTYEFWCRFDSIPGTCGFFGQTQTTGTGGDAYERGMYCYFESSSTGVCYFRWRSATTSSRRISVSYHPNFEANCWYHLAWVRKGGIITPYQNGRRMVSANHPAAPSEDDVQVGGDTLVDCDGVLEIGKGNAFEMAAGYMDEIRFTKGVAKYTTPFNPNEDAYPVTRIYAINSTGAKTMIG